MPISDNSSRHKSRRGCMASHLDGGSSRRASLRAESVREQGLCKRERRQGSVGRRLTAFDGLCEVIKTTAAV